jgi:hypothetical protein
MALNEKSTGDYGYVAFYKGKRYEVYGKTLLAARGIGKEVMLNRASRIGAQECCLLPKLTYHEQLRMGDKAYNT